MVSWRWQRGTKGSSRCSSPYQTIIAANIPLAKASQMVGTRINGWADYSSHGGQTLTAQFCGKGRGYREDDEHISHSAGIRNLKLMTIQWNTYHNWEVQGAFRAQKREHFMFYLILKLFMKKFMHGHIPSRLWTSCMCFIFTFSPSCWHNALHKIGAWTFVKLMFSHKGSPIYFRLQRKEKTHIHSNTYLYILQSFQWAHNPYS